MRAASLRPLLLGIAWWSTSVAAASQILTIPFIWSSAELQGGVLSHAAMLVPIDAGQHGGAFLQFDTGAQYSLIYSSAVEQLRSSGVLIPADKAGIEAQGNQPGYEWSIDIRAGEGRVLARAKQIDHGFEGEAAGTLGADFIDGSLVVIDYRQQRIHLVRGDAQGAIAHCLFKNSKHSVDIALVGNRIGLPIKVAGKELSPILFDTGSSSFGLILFDRSKWDSLGTPAASPKVLTLSEANTLQGPMSITSKIVNGQLCVGTSCVHQPEVGWLGFQAVPGFVGTIGNREFGSGFVVLDYGQLRALVSRTSFGASKRRCMREGVAQLRAVNGN